MSASNNRRKAAAKVAAGTAENPSPDQVRDEIAGHPAAFKAELMGNGDNGIPDVVLAAWDAFVVTCRAGGFSVHGALSGKREAYHGADGVLVEALTIARNAQDVPNGGDE